MRVTRMVNEPFQWSACTEALARRLNIFPGSASPSEVSRISLYEQIWDFAQNERTRQNKNGSCFVLGISAPQGAGKTVLTKALEFIAEWPCSNSDGGGGTGYHCASLSLDDFYLKGADQDKFEKDTVSNPLLIGRGNPGINTALITACALKYIIINIICVGLLLLLLLLSYFLFSSFHRNS